MGIIRNTTEGIYPLQPYQQALWDKINQGGFKPGQMTLYSAVQQSAVQQTGKSTLNSLIKSLYHSNLCNEIVLPMKPEPKYKFSRRNWYVADFDWVHHGEVLAWCSQQFGPHPARPDAWSRWYNKYSEKIHFRDEKDYEWFVLKWQ
jgi:hypothetical protein